MHECKAGIAARTKVCVLAALIAGAWSGAAARGQDVGSIAGWGGQVVVPPSALTDLVAVAGGRGPQLGPQGRRLGCGLGKQPLWHVQRPVAQHGLRRSRCW